MKEIIRPVCPKCKKPMRLWATGRTARHFHCKDCAKSKLVDKEDKNGQ